VHDRPGQVLVPDLIGHGYDGVLGPTGQAVRRGVAVGDLAHREAKHDRLAGSGGHFDGHPIA
jgi:hypothetical protein